MRRQVLVAAAAALAACEQPLKVAGPGQPQVTQVVVAPNPVTLQLSQGQQFRAFGRTQLGDSVGISASWSATGGIISAAGLYTAGQTSGTYQVTAAQSGGSLAASASVTVLAVPVAAVTVSPTTASVLSGQTVQLTATPRDANGTPLSGRVVTWTSVNPAIATVSAAGLVTGVAAGPATITATSEGKSGTAAVTVSNVPVASVVVSPTAANVSVGGTVQLSATPTDAAGAVLTGRVVTWTSVNPAIATVSAAGLVTGVAAGSATITATSEGKSGTAAVTVTAAGGTILFQEAFADNAFATRGWYDNTSLVTTTAQHMPGSAAALEAHFLPRATTPTWGGSARHLFPATATLYVSYWVKYSANWVGSGRPYHPHEFLVMSDLDGDYDGLSNGWLVAYIEHNYQNGGLPRLALQDNKAINTSYGTPPINLINLTENRSTDGCNGVLEPNVVATCFNMPPWYNDKEMQAAQVWFQPNPGPGYKGDWNHVEVYFQINSIIGGKGVADGVTQYWFNGTLVIDRHDILFRTGARPSINFHQFVIAPYIGDGSPVDQYMWVDSLTVATAKP
jgi:uncharacterized protein YjdB